MPNDRAAVAREVLTELLEFANARAETVSDTKQFMRERYPVPPAPETVTVVNDGVRVTLARNARGGWNNAFGNECFVATSFSADLCDRIASDARVIAERDARIAELDDELTELRPLAKGANDTINDLMHTQDLLKARTAERDAALRALEEAKNRPCPCAVASKTLEDEMSHGEEPECPAAAARLAATAPAPIPLGAVLEVEGDPDSSYERVSGGWIRECTPRVMRVQRLEKVYRDDDAAWGNMLTRYYHARHPVATRETVERVEEAIDEAASNTHSLREMARAALSAAGFTLEGA